MQLLNEYILKKGLVIGDDILKVDMFLNHQIDVALLNEIGKEFKTLFMNYPINKILTVESSGIGIACITAQYFSVPVVFAKKTSGRNSGNIGYYSEVHSFTKGVTYNAFVSKDYLNENDNVLIIDDFLANGRAALGLIDICSQANARVIGVGVIIEKSFQGGGDIIRNKGILLESLAIVDSLSGGQVVLRNTDC